MKRISPKKAKKIKVIFSDVDGTLTDGGLFYSSSGETLKKFHAHDGQGIKIWQLSGGLFGFLSARQCPCVSQRANELKIDECALGIYDKLSWMKRWLETQNLTFENLAYIGDDLNDLELIKHSAYSGTPSDAIKIIRKKSSYICKKAGGQGAVREFIDLILFLKSSNI